MRFETSTKNFSTYYREACSTQRGRDEYMLLQPMYGMRLHTVERSNKSSPN